MKALILALLALLITAEALTAAAQAPEPYYFFAKPALAARKVIPVSELTACMTGDTMKPSVRGKFKNEVSASALNQARLLESGACDVAIAYDDGPDAPARVKKAQTGFAIYKIAGSNLELVVEPEAGFVAVGKMELASQQTLQKKDIAACGDGPLRDAFRPKPRIWKDWSNRSAKFEELKTAKDRELANALLYGCDVWILTSADYKRFAKAYGESYPRFSVAPDRDELTRMK